MPEGSGVSFVASVEELSVPGEELELPVEVGSDAKRGRAEICYLTGLKIETWI